MLIPFQKRKVENNTEEKKADASYNPFIRLQLFISYIHAGG
jgi:hypothetical protein